MEAYDVFKDLAIIIIFAKFFGILARKCKAPQVVGEIVAGLLIGPSVLGLVDQTDFIIQMAEIGVVLLMFSAGLGTDLKELLKTGPVAFLIACCGVFVPLVLGAVFYICYYGAQPWGSEEITCCGPACVCAARPGPGGACPGNWLDRRPACWRRWEPCLPGF